MPSEQVERKLAAILSADVVGYSRLMAEDEARTIRTVTEYREQIAMLVRQHRGRVVDSAGDNLLAGFPTALDAVQAAGEIQRVIQARNADLPIDRRMEFRIGIHMGDVSVEGDRLYGDGVNIAARLEGLADPGSICISSTVHDQVQRKLDLGYDDLGKQELKNIPDPVQAYRVRLEPKADIPAESVPGINELTVPGFGGRPAIAVLPFDSMSEDPRQEYFADGIAEDLITRLSTCGRFPVIARNSSFIYKGRAVDVKQVSRDLGVRYVMEGSVRKAGDRVRISAQLIDASTGAHVWAERYDRELSDIFAVQDEITEAVAAAMYPELRRFEWKRVAQQEPEDFDAYESTMRGWWHLNQFTKDDNAKARSFFRRAIELNPRSSGALAALAWAHVHALVFQWTDLPDQSMAEVTRAARRSVELNADSPLAHIALSMAHSLTGDRKEMVAAAERAIELNPSNSYAHAQLGHFLGWVGRADDAIAKLEKGMRLSPRDPMMWYFLYGLSVAHFSAERYEDAARWAERSLRANPRWSSSCSLLAASYGHLNELEGAQRTLEELLLLQPEASIRWARQWTSAADPHFVNRYLDGLRKAGLKE